MSTAQEEGLRGGCRQVALLKTPNFDPRTFAGEDNSNKKHNIE